MLSSPAGPDEPVSSAEQKLAHIWCQTLGLDRVHVRDDFFACGGDSLAAVEVQAAIAREFGKDLPLAALCQARTVEQQATLVVEQTSAPPQSPLIFLQPSGPNPPFFCVHGVGGCVLSFSALASLCAPQQPFCAIQATAARPQESPLTRIEDMAAHYVRALR